LELSGIPEPAGEQFDPADGDYLRDPFWREFRHSLVMQAERIAAPSHCYQRTAIHGDNLRFTEPCITKLSQDNQPPYDDPLRSGHPQAQSPETTPTLAKPDTDSLAVLPVNVQKDKPRTSF
jgi:hypothetical protein